MDDRERREILLQPILGWAGLMLLLGATLGYAFLPGAPGKIVVALAIAAADAALVATMFMRLGQASAIVRLAAIGGVAWLSLLFLFSFADFLTR